MKIGLIFGGIVIAVLGGLVFAGMLPLQIAPTGTSVKVFTNEPPGAGESLDAGLAYATISTYAKYTGSSARLRATSDESDGPQYFDVFVKCGARLVWGAQYRPVLTLAREWYTFAKAAGTPDKFVDAGEECTLSVRAKFLPPGSVAISQAGTGDEIVGVVWGEPGSTTSSSDEPGSPSTSNGTFTSTEPTTEGDDGPSPPPPPATYVMILGILLILIGALIAIVGIFV